MIFSFKLHVRFLLYRFTLQKMMTSNLDIVGRVSNAESAEKCTSKLFTYATAKVKFDARFDGTRIFSLIFAELHIKLYIPNVSKIDELSYRNVFRFPLLSISIFCVYSRKFSSYLNNRDFEGQPQIERPE